LSRRHFNLALDGSGAFFRTGDLGFIQDRRLYFTGRLKNVITVRGRSLHAEDIESLLQLETVDTGLQRCVAVGIQIDDIDSFVILAEHRSRKLVQPLEGAAQLERQIKNLVCDTFGVIPHEVLILPAASLPLTTSGKPARSRCRDVYTDYRKVSDSGIKSLPCAQTYTRKEASVHV
jgi:acyl-CoA synthetase (AMP-forming)/AMP-acid ligase II